MVGEWDFLPASPALGIPVFMTEEKEHHQQLLVAASFLADPDLSHLPLGEATLACAAPDVAEP